MILCKRAWNCKELCPLLNSWIKVWRGPSWEVAQVQEMCISQTRLARKILSSDIFTWCMVIGQQTLEVTQSSSKMTLKRPLIIKEKSSMYQEKGFVRWRKQRNLRSLDVLSRAYFIHPQKPKSAMSQWHQKMTFQSFGTREPASAWLMIVLTSYNLATTQT